MADLWNIGGALLGGLLGGQSSTQSNSTTASPYAPAQPWINSNISSGQSLQSKYQANPLSLGQIGAYGNSLGLSEGFRGQAADLTKQMSNMAQFDRNNPTGKATQFNFSSVPLNVNSVNEKLLGSLPSASMGTLAQQASQSGYGGLLGSSGSSGSSGSNPAATNLTDDQWAAVKQMRDEIGWDNPFDTAGLKGFMAALTGSPVAAINFGKQAMPALENYMAKIAADKAEAQRIQEVAAAYGGGSGGGARSYFGGGYDGSGFAGLGSTGYGNFTRTGDANVSASSISEN